LVDANYGQSTDLVYKFCRESRHAAVLPSHGKGYTAASIPISQHRTKPGEVLGLNWLVTNGQGHRGIRHVVYDTNFWKTFLQHRLAAPMGAPSGLSLFGSQKYEHGLFAEQLSAEFRVKTEGRGRRVDEWKCTPGRDNHWLDCVVGAAVAASLCGVKMESMGNGGNQAERRTFKLPSRR